jgi:hypothetical protein
MCSSKKWSQGSTTARAQVVTSQQEFAKLRSRSYNETATSELNATGIDEATTTAFRGSPS